MNIINNNPYRSLGVYSNSPTKVRLANSNRMKAFLKVGKSVSFPLDLPNVLSGINRTEEIVAEAEAKLSLPQDQIMYSQFWFVKMTPFDDVAFNHLLAGDICKAEEIWHKKEEASSLQNLIVCALVRDDYDRAIQCAEKLYVNEEYVGQLVSAVAGVGGNIDTSNLAFSFLDTLCEEIDASKLLPSVTIASWRSHIEENAVKPLVQKIEAAIGEAKKSKGNGAEASFKAGETLQKNTTDELARLKQFLSASDLQYQTIADKLGLAILDCGIAYYNNSDEPDAAVKANNAMVLQKYAQSIVVGQMAKDRCKENVDILQKTIDNLPPSDVYEEDKAIREELRKYCQLPDKICHAITLLNNTKPYLQEIKRKLGANNDYYLRISTEVVDNALYNLIEEVNAAQKQSTNKKVKTLRDAWKATLIMDTFDMDNDFKKNRYGSNRSTLKGLYERNDAACHPYLAVTILIIVTLVVGFIWQKCNTHTPDPTIICTGLCLISFLYPWYTRPEGHECQGCIDIFAWLSCLFSMFIIPLHFFAYLVILHFTKDTNTTEG